MFETSVIHAPALVAQRRASLVSLSLGAHTAVLVGAIVLSVAVIDFPTGVPRQMAMFAVAPQPNLGDENGGKREEERKQPAATQPEVIKQQQQTAPADAPLTIQTTDSPSDSNNISNSSSTGPEGPGLVDLPLGRPDGTPESDGPIDQPLTVDVPAIHQPGVGDVKPARVLTRVDPIYPNVMRMTKMSATVRIRCIIGADGRVRDAEVLVSSYPPFNHSVLQALEQWTFAPGTLRSKPVDTYFDLTVTFNVR